MRQIAVVALAAGLAWTPMSQAQDVAKAEATIKSSGCLKCHSVSADKDGPSYKKVAAKYKGKGDAAAKLEGELKAGKLTVDGKDTKHATVKGGADDIKNVVAYILSR
jgi:cytochrome c